MCRVLGLAAALCAAGACAQEPAVAQERQDTEPRPRIVVPPDIPWHTFSWIERRYKIEALRFKARDETGYDWAGSDEVMVTTEDAMGWTVSNEIGDIDSGNVHNFDPAKSCIISVRAGVVVLGRTSVCDDLGGAAPLGFRVEMWEKDGFGWPPGFCAPLAPEPGRHAGPHCPDDGNGDDFIGDAQIDLGIAELEAALPTVGAEHIETVVLNPCRGDVCDVTYGPDYSFTYRITRLPDVEVRLEAVLKEAMSKIGARSELEAITAGLRALRAPAARKTEADPEPAPGR
jgi:hypothetical protein